MVWDLGSRIIHIQIENAIVRQFSLINSSELIILEETTMKLAYAAEIPLLRKLAVYRRKSTNNESSLNWNLLSYLVDLSYRGRVITLTFESTI